MKFLLKIVQGPNAGAEIALVEGVRVTLGSADSCDIVLADPTLPAEACAIEASADSVSLTPSGAEPERLEPLRVRSFGSTALAVGPADSPWGPLDWEAPAAAEPPADAGEARPESAPPKEADSVAPDSTKSSGPEKAGASSAGSEPRPAETRSRSRGRRIGCLVLLLLALLFSAWLLTRRWRTVSESPAAFASPKPPLTESASSRIAAIAARLGLEHFPTNEPPLVRGDFATRAERLAATAALYEAQPGIKLDLADRETLLTAASDLLAAATDGALEVRDVTNRIAVLAGRAPDPAFLASALDALRTDVPRLAGIDTAAISLDSPISAPVAAEGPAARASQAAAAPRAPRLPLCGILLQPYPCLVLQNGQRLSEGAEIGGYKIVSIAPDRIRVRRDEEEEIEWTP